MKKLILIGVGLCASFGVMAQTDLVKQVERSIKGANPNYSQALADIQPALTNSETSGQMNTWYVAGKAAFGVFDDAFKKAASGQELSNDEKKKAGNAYVNGFDYYMQALSLDSLPDEKGKIKPKKSKEILNTIKGAQPYLNYAAGFLFDTNDYDNAYRALDLYITTPSNPKLAKNPPVQLADSVRGQMLLAEAQALLLSNEANPDKSKAQKALDVLRQIPATGYDSENTYQFGLIAARAVGDKAAKTEFAQAAYDKYGASNVQYIGELINDKLDVSDYPGALALVDQALTVVTPDNKDMLSQLYNIRGIIDQRGEKYDDAEKDFTKAVEYNSENFDSMFNLANTILAQIDAKMAANDNLTSKSFESDLLKAADLLEKCYNHDESQFSNAAYSLYRIYYNLGANYVDKAKYWELLK